LEKLFKKSGNAFYTFLTGARNREWEGYFLHGSL
jgi:hypothetical protein